MKFLEKTDNYSSSNSFISHISEVETKEQLLHQLYKKLQFPTYFGFNWDALWDCLMDFSWIEERKIIIVHDIPLKMDLANLKIYLQILEDAVQKWKNYEEHELEVVFSYDQKQMIMDILESINQQKGIN